MNAKKVVEEIHSLHDSFLKRIDIDYSKNMAELHYDVWPYEKDGETEKDMYPAKLVVKDLWYIVMEPPRYSSEHSLGGLNTSELITCDKVVHNGVQIPTVVPDGYLVIAQHVSTTNSYIFIVAKEIEFISER